MHDALVAARAVKKADGGACAQVKSKLAATKADEDKRWLQLGVTLEGLGLGEAAESQLSAQVRVRVRVRVLGQG